MFPTPVTDTYLLIISFLSKVYFDYIPVATAIIDYKDSEIDGGRCS
jgi:hypothetical protein